MTTCTAALTYDGLMKRLQILIEEELNAELERTAHSRKLSKAALIREIVRDRLVPLPPLETDPLWQMVGADACDPEESIDDVAYR